MTQSSFSVTGLDKIRKLVRNAEKIIGDAGEQWVKVVTNHVAERAEVNAPILTGLLRTEIQPQPIKRTRDRVSCVINDDTHYAWEMHEFQTPARPMKYGLGPITREQPETIENGPGGKYFTRVANHYNKLYEDILKNMLHDAFLGKDFTAGTGRLEPSSRHTAVTGG